MAQTIRCQVTLNPLADPRQHIINTWHCTTVGASTPVEAATAFQTNLNTFYQAVDTYLSNELNGAVPRFRAFNLLELKPRQPIRDESMTALVAGGNMAPRELCLCVSYRAEYVSGVTPKRRRGRIYLGPLASSTLNTANGNATAAATNAINAAADALLEASKISASFSWVVYSPTSDANQHGEAGFYPVIAGWVDDNVDVQRRRSSGYVENKPTFS